MSTLENVIFAGLVGLLGLFVGHITLAAIASGVGFLAVLGLITVGSLTYLIGLILADTF